MQSNRSVPAASVIPVLAYADVVGASDWLCNAFGFKLRLRIGGHRAQLVFGDGAVIATELRGDGDATPPDARAHSVHVASRMHKAIADTRRAEAHGS